MPTKGLILGYASLWHALLENRKRYELRRALVEVPHGGLRLLFVCSGRVREREGLSLEMAEGFCYRRLGPYTADYIISREDLLGRVFATPDEYLSRNVGASFGQSAIFRAVGCSLPGCSSPCRMHSHKVRRQFVFESKSRSAQFKMKTTKRI